jgi:hypothetical protein
MSAIQNPSAYFAAAFRSSSTDTQKAAVHALEDQFLLNRNVTQGRKCPTDLDVPYSQRQYAYAQGARRDHHRKIWYAPASTPLWKVALWLKNEDVCKQASLDYMRRFIASTVKQECSLLCHGAERMTVLQDLRNLAQLYSVAVKPEDLFLFAATAEKPKECVARLRTMLTHEVINDERLGEVIHRAGDLFIPRWRLNGNLRAANSLCQLLDLTIEYCGMASAKHLVSQALAYRRMPACLELMKRCQLLGVD